MTGLKSVAGIIVLVVFVLVLTAMGPTIVSDTHTGTCTLNNETGTNCNLENRSSSSASMYSLIEIMYPIIGLLAVVAFAMGKRSE